MTAMTVKTTTESRRKIPQRPLSMTTSCFCLRAACQVRIGLVRLAGNEVNKLVEFRSRAKVERVAPENLKPPINADARGFVGSIGVNRCASAVPYRGLLASFLSAGGCDASRLS